MVTPELQAKIERSIARLQRFCPEEGYYLAFSGGKDSIVCKQLLIESGCKFDAHYRVTSVDPPELVRYIKEHHPDVSREVPRYPDGKPINMWNLIVKKKMMPTRMTRYCCAELKESGGTGRIVVTGVRWAESPNRKINQGEVTIFTKNSKKTTKVFTDTGDFSETKRGGVILTNDNDESRSLIEQCYKNNKTSVNPIIDWEDTDVWDYIKDRKLPYCSLYDEGWKRLGCIGCPMASTKSREKEFNRYPKYKDAYIRAIGKMIKVRVEAGLPCKWTTVQDLYNRWMEYDVLPGQIDMFGEEYETETYD